MMRRALALAERGWGRTWPNPLVGAVIVQNGSVVGEGWHREYGELHAEAVALRAAGDAARGATIYLTLEPCNHTGKQPPCSQALIRAGLSRAVIALPDPNPEAQGGVAQLTQAGLTVTLGVLAPEASRQNFRFLHRFALSERPFIAIKLAVSMDGRIADAQGHSRWISGPSARDWVHRERAGYGAIGIGGTTLLTDNPLLTVRGVVEPRIPPTRVIFDRSGKVTPSARIFLESPDVPVIVMTASSSAEYRGALEARGARVRVADGLAAALVALKREGVDSMLVEGGGKLAGELLQAGLVDRIYQVQAPVWLGDAGISAWHNPTEVRIETAKRWHTVERRCLGDDTLLVLEP